MTEIFTAKSVDEAKALAASKFGKKISEIKFEIIDEGKKGFLGLGKTDAKVKATYTEQTASAPAEETQPVTAEVPVTEEIIVSEEKTAEEVAEEAAETVAETVTEEAPAQAEEEKKEEVHVNTHDEEEEFSLDKFTLIEDEALINPKVKISIDYITSVLRAMEIEAKYTVYQNETGAVIDIDSDNNGTVIGRRGETLDSLQYLCSIISNKGDKDYYRITINCLGYRQKRRETLEQLAAKVAKTVLRTGRPQPLEPMNPYERRVIHSAIAEIEGVSSRSTGDEPYRKIIISSNNPKAARHRGGRNDRNDRRGGGRRNDRRNNNNNKDRAQQPLERKKIDLSTSFEKDYKKPKPEDTMEGGLYGKIEL